nr:metabolite ABC transporter [Raoultella sp. NCTC 9187]
MIQEPDAGFNPFQMAPRLMMNTADVAKTGAVQPGSRVSWRYKFAGTAPQLAEYEQWLLPKLGTEHRWIGLEQDDSALGKSSNARSSSCCSRRCSPSCWRWRR